ncbi:GIY-YIG nuclease family protein [Mucilaginibacter terrigena]|nr:GIY-YIG nuclease family protein [Mucilaginibacter terrigena]
MPKVYRGFESNINEYKMYYSYILKSLKDERYYYGSTNDVNKRLLKHNSGQVKSTKHRAPFVVHFVEEHLNRTLAFKRELFYKSVDGYRYLKENKIT